MAHAALSLQELSTVAKNGKGIIYLAPDEPTVPLSRPLSPSPCKPYSCPEISFPLFLWIPANRVFPAWPAVQEVFLLLRVGFIVLFGSPAPSLPDEWGNAQLNGCSHVARGLEIWWLFGWITSCLWWNPGMVHYSIGWCEEFVEGSFYVFAPVDFVIYEGSDSLGLRKNQVNLFTI